MINKRYIVLAFLCVVVFIKAQDCFRLDSSFNKIEWNIEKGTITSNVAYKLHVENKRISGLSLSGLVIKNSPEYLVRVILKDQKGHEHLILETYEETNNCDSIRFENYGEESILLENIVPDSIIIYVKDASLRIYTLTAKEETKEMVSRQQRYDIRKEQIHSIIDRINAYNQENERPWVAGETELSLLPYEIKKNVLGISDDTPSGGFEYYTAGFFVVGHAPVQTSRSLDDPFVDSFDWRNRHGKNWMTGIRHQGYTQYCSAYAALGCLESLTKLYFNNADLELDLSEQEIASCYDTNPHKFYQPLSYAGVMDYIHEHGVCDEDVYPLDTLGYYDLSYVPTCNSGIVVPNEQIRSGSPETTIASSLQDIKRALIAHGPLYSGWHPSNDSGHAMALVGYGKIQANDAISIYNPNTNGASTLNPVPTAYVGSTYWIFKNSYGINGIHQGYYYLIFSSMVGDNSNISIQNMTLPSYLGLPVISMNYNSDDIIVEDADGDGFYYWGIGDKPQGCPSWIPETPDGDDSDSTKSGMNEYGHLENIADRVSGPWTLLNDFSYNGTNNVLLYDDIIIPNGRTLTISSSVVCIGNASITVQNGGTLVIDGGILANALINLSSSSHVRIVNGGTIYMRKNRYFSAPVGCVVEIENGEIRGPYIKKSAKWN